jgi:hypothetical protein
VDFDVARDGTLLYVPGGVQTRGRTLVWVDRQGREQPIAAPPRACTYPRISPDGTRIVLDIRDQDNDLWMWDITRQTLARLTLDPTFDSLACVDARRSKNSLQLRPRRPYHLQRH